jgi:L-methionine (R)-S-oxide reductase
VTPVADAAPVLRALRAAHLHDQPAQTLLSLACERVQAWGPPFTSVYAYLLDDAGLALAAYAGRATDHTRIAVGAGVCGTAVATGRDQNVPDVSRAENYLACNAETRSELVVLIRRGDTILGQLDVDSDVPAGFSEAHHAALRQVADALAVLL